VADAVRTAHVDRLVNRSGSVGLSGVDRDRDVVVADELERAKMMLGRMIVLGAS